MASHRQIDSRLDRVAAVLDDWIGQGKQLGAVEVAEETGVDAATVRNYTAGRTTPDLRWMLLFMAAYENRFPQIIEQVWAAALDGSSYRLCRIRPFDDHELDANNDGTVDGRDVQAHTLKAAAKGVELQQVIHEALADGRITSDELRQILVKHSEQHRHEEAAVAAARRDSERFRRSA